MPDFNTDNKPTTAADTTSPGLDAPMPTQPNTAPINAPAIPTPTATLQQLHTLDQIQSGQQLNNPQNQVQNEVQTAESDAHSQRLSRLQKTFDVLAGPTQHEYSVKPDGSIVATPKPLDTKTAMLKFALGLVSGALSGAGEHGPGSVGRSAEKGVQAGQQQVQQTVDQDTKRRNETLQNYQSQQAQVAAQQRNAKAALEVQSLAQSVGSKELEQNQDLIAQTDEFHNQLDADQNVVPGYSTDTLWEDQLHQLVKEGKVDPTKVGALMVDVRQKMDANGPVYDKNGKPVYDHGFRLYDPSKKMNWPQQTIDGAKRYGIPDIIDPKTGEPRTLTAAQGSAGQIAAISRKVQMLDNMQHTLDQQYAKYNEFKDSDAPDMKAPDIAAMYKADPKGTMNAVAAWQRVDSKEVSHALDELSKPEYKNLGNASGLLTQMFGGRTQVDDYETKKKLDLEQQTSDIHEASSIRKEERKAKLEQDYQDQMNAFLQAPEGWSPDRDQAAMIDQNMSAAQARSYLENKGMNLPTNFETLWDIAHYKSDKKTLPTRISMKTGQMDEQTGEAFIKKFLNKDYNQPNYKAAQTWYSSLADTKPNSVGGKLNAMGTAVGHLHLMEDLAKANAFSDINRVQGFVNRIKTELGDDRVTNLQTAIDAVQHEVQNVLAGGSADVSSLNVAREGLNKDQSIKQILGYRDTAMRLMQTRINELNNQGRRYTGENLPVSPQAMYEYNRLGLTVNGQKGIPLPPQADKYLKMMQEGQTMTDPRTGTWMKKNGKLVHMIE